jgi:hypothetical protein
MEEIKDRRISISQGRFYADIGIVEKAITISTCIEFFNEEFMESCLRLEVLGIYFQTGIVWSKKHTPKVAGEK